jgi:hypothetical protein
VASWGSHHRKELSTQSQLDVCADHGALLWVWLWSRRPCAVYGGQRPVRKSVTLYYKYEKDQPAGAILKFVVNKYLEVYGTDNGRVA